MEAVQLSIFYHLSKKELGELKISKLRGFKDRKEAQIKIGKQQYGFAVVSGLKNANDLIKEIREGRKDIHFVEIMACPGGCVNGGGQPFNLGDKELKAISKTLYDMDEKEAINVAHKNSGVIELYNDFLGEPLSEKCRKFLHTKYTQRDVLL